MSEDPPSPLALHLAASSHREGRVASSPNYLHLTGVIRLVPSEQVGFVCPTSAGPSCRRANDAEGDGALAAETRRRLREAANRRGHEEDSDTEVDRRAMC